MEHGVVYAAVVFASHITLNVAAYSSARDNIQMSYSCWANETRNQTHL